MENRQSPRYRVYLPVVVDGIELTANNVSSTGLQVSCPDFLYGRIQDTVETSSFSVDIQIPKSESPCQTSCKMIYHSVFGDEYLIGLEYLDVEASHQQVLDSYLKDLAASNAPLVE